MAEPAHTSLTPGTLGPEHVVYRAKIELFSWSHTSNGGRRIRLRLNEREELAHFEAAKMVKKSRTGNPRAGENYRMLIADPDNEDPLLTVDLWYRQPSWTQSMGATVTFEIEEEGFDFFTEYRTADVAETGAEFMVTLIQLDENGHPVDQQKRLRVLSARENKKGGPHSKHVAMLCQAGDFAVWFCTDYLQVGKALNENQIAARVREICGIGSRAEFDHDDLAWRKWQSIESQFIRAMRAPS